MTICKREQIFQNLEETLEQIKVVNGYRLDVELVSRDLLHWEEVPVDRFPALFLVDGDEDLAYETTTTTGNKLRPVIVGYVRKQEEVSSELHKLMADVIKAVRADITRSGVAMVTGVMSISTDRGSLRPYGAFEMTLEVRYKDKPC